MPAQTRQIRRGLPRVSGGEPWPQAAELDASLVAPPGSAVEPEVSPAESVEEPAPDVTPASAPSAAPSIGSAAAPAMRRGLPRVAGGEPWPPAAGTASVPAPPPPGAQAPPPAVRIEDAPEAAASPLSGSPTGTSETSSVASAPLGGAPIRRGLPRVAGGDPWPPSDARGAASAIAPKAPDADREPAPVAESAPVAEPARAKRDVSTPLPFRRTVWPGAAASVRPAPRPEPVRIRGLTKGQWAGLVIVGGGALLVAAFLLVTITRWSVSLEFMQDFLATYPGEAHLPEGAPVGIPAWLGWQHFFNVFLMVLIIRSGLQVRTEKRPAMFWSPRNNPKRKISLALWFHQSLDILWIANGAIYIVLLFATGQWVRVVPTSWEVLPNALSAAIQYVSLDWPTENGWVNYNSLQVLAYFTTIFIAAPLAIVTGVRMSGVWPKGATRLNRAYPVEWARAIHFPVMLYFVAFIIVHVALVFATGALRNLNHMYASQGSIDPDAYTANWTGFWIFFVSLLVIIGGWIAARPLVLSGIARAFGKVSGR